MADSATATMSRPTIGCILSQFPRYDEAFILRELVELSRGPWELVIFSLRPCRDRVIHAQAKALQPQTIYAPFVRSREVWRSHGYFLRRDARAYWGSLDWIVSRHWRHPIVLIKSLILFPKIVHFARLAMERGVTHLHAFWATYPSTAAVVTNRLIGLPFSMSGHAHDIYMTSPALAEKITRSRFLLTCTEANKQYLDRLISDHQARVSSSTAPAGKVIVSYHGVDLTRFTATEKPDSPACHVLIVGSLFPCKGLETLIDGCKLLKDRGVAFRCTIAGGGPLEKSLRQQIERLGLGHEITITGYVSQEIVVGLYQQAHVFALPLVSRIHWGIPNVVIEALATKTPIICCDLPSLKELAVHGESGWIIPEHDPAAVADAVERLWKDPGLRLRLGESGYRRVVERFALERTGEALRRVFSEAIDRAAGRAGTSHQRVIKSAAPSSPRARGSELPASS